MTTIPERRRAKLFLIAALLCLAAPPAKPAAAEPAAAEESFASATASFKSADYQRALHHAEAAFRQCPRSKRYANLYGWALLKAGRIDEAVAAQRQAEALDPFFIETIQFGAWLAYFRHDTEAARAGFQREMDWVDGYRHKDAYRRGRFGRDDYTYFGTIAADAGYGLGLLALERGDLAAGRAYLERAAGFAAYSSHTDALRALADIQSRLGDAEAAAATRQRLRDDGGDDPGAAAK